MLLSDTEVSAPDTLSQPFAPLTGLSVSPRRFSAYSLQAAQAAGLLPPSMVRPGSRQPSCLRDRSRLKWTKHCPSGSLRNAFLLAWAESSAQSVSLVLKLQLLSVSLPSPFLCDHSHPFKA